MSPGLQRLLDAMTSAYRAGIPFRFESVPGEPNDEHDPEWYVRHRQESEEVRSVHLELFKRLDDLRLCPQCGAYFLTEYKRSVFCSRPCRSKLKNKLDHLKDRLVAAKARINKKPDEIKRLTAKIAVLEGLKRPL